MSLIFSRQSFNPSCPSGGTWYACASGSNFVGCCKSEPCSNGCSDGNLAPASFDPNYYGQFPDQQCPSGSRWFTCSKTSPPFLGCCKSNPCTSGCPAGDVTAAFLSSNPKLAAPYLPSGASSSASATATSSSASASSTSGKPTSSLVAITNSPTSSSQPSATNTPSSTPIGAIVGGVVGGVAALALLVGILLFYCRRRTRNSRQHMSNTRVGPEKLPFSSDAQGAEVASKGAKGTEYQDSPHPTPTPMYTPYATTAPSSPNPSKNPPGYPDVISELDSTTTHVKPHELESPDPSAGNASWELSSMNSTKGRGKGRGRGGPGYGRVPDGDW